MNYELNIIKVLRALIVSATLATHGLRNAALVGSQHFRKESRKRLTIVPFPVATEHRQSIAYSASLDPNSHLDKIRSLSFVHKLRKNHETTQAILMAAFKYLFHIFQKTCRDAARCGNNS